MVGVLIRGCPTRCIGRMSDRLANARASRRCRRTPCDCWRLLLSMTEDLQIEQPGRATLDLANTQDQFPRRLALLKVWTS